MTNKQTESIRRIVESRYAKKARLKLFLKRNLERRGYEQYVKIVGFPIGWGDSRRRQLSTNRLLLQERVPLMPIRLWDYKISRVGRLVCAFANYKFYSLTHCNIHSRPEAVTLNIKVDNKPMERRVYFFFNKPYVNSDMLIVVPVKYNYPRIDAFIQDFHLAAVSSMVAGRGVDVSDFVPLSDFTFYLSHPHEAVRNGIVVASGNTTGLETRTSSEVDNLNYSNTITSWLSEYLTTSSTTPPTEVPEANVIEPMCDVLEE